MASFARKGFSPASYAAFRPAYPPSLFRTIMDYHSQAPPPPSPHPATLLDLGCGHGPVSRALAPSFDRVLALDPSAGMVAQALQLSEGHAHISVRQGGVEDLAAAGVEPGSVDCAAAAQAAHWFDYSRAWPQLARAVRPGGTLALWGYKDHVLIGYPATAPVFERFTYGIGEVAPGLEGMGRFWEMPGRGILRDLLRSVVPPEGEWGDVRRLAWDPDRETGNIETAPKEVSWMRKRLRLGELESYVRTYSAFANWREAHPGLRSRAEGGEGDIVDSMFDEVIAVVPEWKAQADRWRDIETEAVWGTVILLARRR